MALNFSNFTSTWQQEEDYSSTISIYDDTTTIEPLVILGYNIDGLELTLLYCGLNVIILIIILILACRSGAKKTKQERLEKRLKQQRQMQQQQQQQQQPGKEPQIIQLSVRGRPDRAESVHSEYSVDSSKRQNNDHMLEDIHGQVSSLGKVNSVKICCGAFVDDIMNRSFIYSAFLVHVWDQGSDLGVIYTWFTEDDGRWTYLGWIALGIMMNYRIFSAYSLRKAQRGWRDTILQVLDLQLFVDVYRSFEDVKPTDSLYWIRAMEAVLESCLQILLQFVYLYQENDVLVWLSLFGSMGSLVFSLLHYTDVVFVFEDGESFCESIKWYIAYASRFLFRLFEVTSRCMVLALIWSTWNSSDQTDLTGLYIVGFIMGGELVFYAFLTQVRIPPWEIAAFLIVNIDLTLTFEGRAGALTKPLRNNPLYLICCKPVAEMFTQITDETEQYYEENKLNHHRHSTHHRKVGKKKGNDPNRQKLLIAPAHYVYRFLESIFELFCVLTYAIIYNEDNSLFSDNRWWQISIATITTILTPIFYCIIRAFADESKTLERNLIAMVHHDAETKEIKKLIGAGASLTQTDYEGNNIVHACIMKNNYDLLSRVIRKYKKDKKSVKIHATNKKGYTPLLLTAKHGSIDCLKLLSALNQEIQNEDDKFDFNQVHIHSGQSIIHIAAQYDQAEIIEYLITDKNCMVNIHQKYTYITDSKAEIRGYNALHVAARYNSVNVFGILLNCGVSFTDRLSNNDSCSIIAASRGHTIILQQLYDIGDNFNVRGNFGHTPLYRAALNNHPGTVQILGRDFGANPNIPDENNVNIIQQCFNNCIFGVLSSLANLGLRFDSTRCNLEIEITKKDDIDDKLTALMWASKYNYPRLVKTLLDSGANPNYTNKLHETAAHHAAAMGSLECIKLLSQYNANLQLANGANQTPRDKAIQQNRKNVIQWFNAMPKK